MEENNFSSRIQSAAATIGFGVWCFFIMVLCIFGIILLFDSGAWQFGLGLLAAAFLFTVPLIALKKLLRPFNEN